MRKPQYTSGPLQYERDGEYGGRVWGYHCGTVARLDADPALVMDGVQNLDEMHATGGLFAAAPELAEAVRALLREIWYCVEEGTLSRNAVDTHETIINARALLARLDGEGGQ